MTGTPAPNRSESQARRARLRSPLLLWSSPVLIVLLVVAAMLFSVPILTSRGVTQYDDNDLPRSIRTFTRLQGFTITERWLVSFNLGTALLKDGQIEDALDELDTAYGFVPAQPDNMSSIDNPQLLPACMVNTNMSIGYELKGDTTQAEADGIVEEMKAAQTELDALGTAAPTDGTAPDPEPFRLDAIDTYLAAEELYRTANTTRLRDECVDNDEAAARNVEKETTAREKRLALENLVDPPPEEPPAEPSTPPTVDPAEQERQDRLDTLKDDAEKDKNLTNDGLDPGGKYDPDVPPW